MTQKKKDYENPYDGQCAILYAMNLIGAKWKIPILWHLTHYGILHYNELKRHLGGVTNTVLARNLKSSRRTAHHPQVEGDRPAVGDV